MNDRLSWLESRREGIGGSDVAAILGVSPWKSAVDVWMDKTGQTPHTEPNEAMHWGTVLEDVVARHYAEINGATVQRINQIIRHPARPWQLANLDRAVVHAGSRARMDGESLKGADGILECKTTSAYKADEWAGDELPMHYTAQVMWYMDITGVPWADVAVLIGGNKYQQRRVEYDSDLAMFIRERCEEFWFKNVHEFVAPEPVSVADVLLLHPEDAGTSIEADHDLLANIQAAQDLRDTIKAEDAALDALTNAIKLRMKDASTVTVGGKPIITWKAAKSSDKTDWKAAFLEAGQWLDTETAALIRDNNTTTTPGSRRFIWKD